MPVPKSGSRPILRVKIRNTKRTLGKTGDTAVGYMTFYFTYSTFLAQPTLFLEDIFVREEYRGQGLAEANAGFVRKVARDRGCGRMEWMVLDWNLPAIRFYEKNRGPAPCLVRVTAGPRSAVAPARLTRPVFPGNATSGWVDRQRGWVWAPCETNRFGKEFRLMINAWLDDKWPQVSRIGTWVVVMSEVPETRACPPYPPGR